MLNQSTMFFVLLAFTVKTLFIQESLQQHQQISSLGRNMVHLRIVAKHVTYTGLTIDNQLPLTFVQGQFYTIRGKINSPSDKSTNVNLILENKITKQKFDFTTIVPAGQRIFSLIVKIPKPGKYYLFLFAGTSGSSDETTYEIKPFSFDQKTGLKSYPGKPQRLSLDMENDKLVLKWTSKLCPIAKIIFSQNSINTKTTFFVTNSQNAFQIPFSQFSAYKPVNTRIQISCANSTSKSLSGRNSGYSQSSYMTFLAGYHNFAVQTKKDKIQISDIPWKIKKNANLLVNGRILSDCQNKVYLEIPSNGFEYFYLDTHSKNDSKIPASSQFNLNLNHFNQSGTYILEINDVNGEAVVNRPIYVGDAYPLLPDYRDLQPPYDKQKIQKQTPSSIASQRNLLLTLINQKRKEWRLPILYLDDTLNRLAQNYAQDMMKRHFFGHYNPEGKGPQDRAKAMGIQSIGQNVAYNQNLTSSHYSLCRSDAHLQNIVNKDWTRVGLGIAFSQKEGVFYVAEEFSTRDLTKFPITSTQNAQMSIQLNKAVSKLCPRITYSLSLSNALKNEVKKPKEAQFSKAFGKQIISYGTSYQYVTIDGSYSPDFIQRNMGPSSNISNICRGYKLFGSSQSVKNELISITLLFVK